MLYALLSMVILPAILRGQSVSSQASSSATGEESAFHGFNAYTSFSGLATGSGALLKLDSSVGYDFNRNFGIYAGMPLYFNNSSGNSGALTTAGAGDAYIGAEFYAFPQAFRYSTTVTVGLPTGNVAKGLSPGVVTADWTNCFRRSFGRLTPSLSFGVANTVGVGLGPVTNDDMIDHGLAATGAFLHLEEGAELELTRRLYVGGAGYHILPFGPQPRMSSATSDAAIVGESGFDTWLGLETNAVWYTEVGYSRSVTFASNSFSFRVGMNVGRMLRRNHR